MATFLVTVKQVEVISLGIRLSPGLRPSQTRDHPAIKSMKQGANLELRLPDGTIRAAKLANYGVSVLRDEEGALYLHDHPSDPEIKLIFPADMSPEQIPVGTEVWLVE